MPDHRRRLRLGLSRHTSPRHCTSVAFHAIPCRMDDRWDELRAQLAAPDPTWRRRAVMALGAVAMIVGIALLVVARSGGASDAPTMRSTPIGADPTTSTTASAGPAQVWPAPATDDPPGVV